MVSSLSSGVGNLFESFRSIWLKIAQYLAVNFVVFRREAQKYFLNQQSRKSYPTVNALQPSLLRTLKMNGVSEFPCGAVG